MSVKRDRLELYYKAEKAVLLGQSYKIGSRALTRADLAEITSMIRRLENEIRLEEKGRGKSTFTLIPKDF